MTFGVIAKIVFFFLFVFSSVLFVGRPLLFASGIFGGYFLFCCNVIYIRCPRKIYQASSTIASNIVKFERAKSTSTLITVVYKHERQYKNIAIVVHSPVRSFARLLYLLLVRFTNIYIFVFLCANFVLYHHP